MQRHALISRVMQKVPNVLLNLAAGDQEGLVNKPAIARLLSVSPRTIDNFVQQKKIPAIKISARCIRFHPASVLAALKRGFELKEAGHDSA
jgi:hypothetical protein